MSMHLCYDVLHKFVIKIYKGIYMMNSNYKRYFIVSGTFKDACCGRA